MGKFMKELKCSCGSEVFAWSQVVIASFEKKDMLRTPDKHLTCLTCLKTYYWIPGQVELQATRQEPGKLLVRSAKARNASDEQIVKDFLKPDKKTKKESTNA